jgi:hypothetical protein
MTGFHRTFHFVLPSPNSRLWRILAIAAEVGGLPLSADCPVSEGAIRGIA